MFKQRKKDYLCPSLKTTAADLEGLICASPLLTMQVDELRNINADSDASAAEELYFEF